MHTMIPDYTIRQRRQFIRSLAGYLRHQIAHGLFGDWVLTFTFRASSPSFGSQRGAYPSFHWAADRPHAWVGVALSPDSDPWQCALAALEEAEELACQ